jgi:hypothetical protein
VTGLKGGRNVDSTSNGEATDDIEDDIDVRTVAVIWGDGVPFPEVTFSGCSPYEAIGLLRVGLRRLEHEFFTELERDDEEDEDDD